MQLGADEETVELFDQALKETQFSKAVSRIKNVIPESLRIDSHNPLNLIHGALSDGIHARSNEECLEYAVAIRALLFDLSEKMAIALKKDNEVKDALTKLLGRNKANGNG